MELAPPAIDGQAPPLVQNEISDAVDKQLLSQTVDNLAFDLLTDVVTDQGLDFEVDFLQKTIQMTKESNDEMWKMQWEAVQNLRIMNKYYYEVVQTQLKDMADFLKAQADNLRSNNSRNSLNLFVELFEENLDKCGATDGRKVGGHWEEFAEKLLPSVLARTYADKQFIAKLAQRGVLACCKTCVIPQTTRIIIEACPSKNMKLSEFAVQALAVQATSAPIQLYGDPEMETHRLDIIQALCEVLEKAQPRMLKHAKPGLKHIEKVMGQDNPTPGIQLLRQEAIKAFLRASQPSQDEEEKEDDEARLLREKDVEKRVDKIFTHLVEKKKPAAKPSNFRKMMMTQKNDLQ